MLKKLFETPHVRHDVETSPNGIFIKLAVVSFCLSISSSVSYWLSFMGGRLTYSEGAPSDEAILYSFLYGLALSQVVTLFLPKGNLSQLFSLHFVKVFLRSLLFVCPCWLIVALGGSVFVGSNDWITGEEEWYQISLVLISVSLTLLTWHVMYHKQYGCGTIKEFHGKLIRPISEPDGKPEPP
ncbi:MAG: hypothetical protein V1809_00635 [Planctomycetota bacterium]